MKKNKKLFAILTLVAFMMTLVPALAFAGEVTVTPTATVTGDKEITIVTNVAMTGTPNATDFVSSVGGVITSATVTGSTIVLDTTSSVAGATPSIVYTPDPAAPISVGNTGDILAGFTVVATNAAPAITSAATTANNAVTVTFNKALATSTPTGLVLKINGTAATATWAASGNTVTATNITPVIAYGDTLVLDCTADVTLADAVGNQVASFAGKSVTNNVPKANAGAADITTSVFGAQYVNGGTPNVDASFNMYALFLDAYRNDVVNANQTLYVWAEDVSNPGTPTSAFVLTGTADMNATHGSGFSNGDQLSNSPNVYTLTGVNNDEKITGKFTRSGEYNIYASMGTVDPTGTGATEAEAVKNTTKMQLGNSKIVVNATTNDPKAHYTATYNGNELKDGDTYEFIQIAANNVANNNIVVTFKNDDNRLVGKTVNIDTNSANITASKTSAVTNSLGQIDFDLSGSREGTYYVYLACDGFEVKLQVKVGNTSATYISASSQPDAPIALYGDNDDLDIRVDLTDVNGNVVTGTNPNGAMNAYTSSTTAVNYKYVAFVTKPTGTVLKDSDLAISYDSEDENYQVTMNNKTFDKEGNYEIKIVLDNGNYVSIPFEVKTFTTPVQLLLDYDQTSIELGGSSNVPTVKYVDANGTKQNAKNKTTLAGTGYAISNFTSDGKITVKNDEKYIGQTITVTAVDSRYNLTATQTLTVADEAQSITFSTTKAQVNVNNKIEFSIVDSLGNVVSLGNNATIKDVNFVVTNIPEGAKVSAVTSGSYQNDLKSTGKATMALTSDKEGDVTVQVLVSVEAPSSTSSTGLKTKYYTGTATFNVAKQIGTGNAVVMTIGSATMVVNDTTVAIDAPAMIKDNRTFVPVRALMEAFGATVDFDATTNVVTIKADGKTITLTLGSSVLTVGDQAVTMDVAAFATNEGRTMVPVRAIAEAAGYTVEATYNADGSTASVVFTK